ncbi:thymidylate synthase [Stenotrophomonas maltophilia]|uniref:thymidylate synthase n=1 Tax=Stenotrophomonas maltophilia TaxID=40324 RepID=UPI0039C34D02
MNIGNFDSSNNLQRKLCELVVSSGEVVNPRGMETREMLGVSFVLNDPRNRLTTLPGRKWSSALAVGELAWHLRGDTNVEPLAFYAPKWRDFADGSGEVRGSCYGARIFQVVDGGASQWERAKNLLTADPYSRRAVLNFQGPENLSSDVNDVSCTISLQFLIRGNRLHAFTTMRSNDAIWGVPYDVFLFTSFQELMALELGCELGFYHHSAASMHIYERHYDLAERLGQVDAQSTADDGLMVAMDRGARESIPLLEESLRTGRDYISGGAFEDMCRMLLLENSKVSALAGDA